MVSLCHHAVRRQVECLPSFVSLIHPFQSPLDIPTSITSTHSTHPLTPPLTPLSLNNLSNRVTTLSYSHTHHRILTSSEDGCVMIWNGMAKGGTVGGKDIPLVVLSHQLHQVANSSSSRSTNLPTTSILGNQGKNVQGSHSKGYSTSISSSFQPRSEQEKNTRNRPFGAPITCAQFFYVDKFVLLAVKATTMLYSYHIG